MITRLFGSIARYSVVHPFRVIAISTLLALACMAAAITSLSLKTSNLDLIDPDLPPVRRFLDFAEEFGTPNVLVAVLEGRNAGELREAVDSLGPGLRAVEGVRSVLDRLPVDPEVLHELDLDSHVMSHDGQMAFVFIQPDDTTSSADTIGPLVESVRTVLTSADLEARGIRAGLTGIPEYAIDDRDVIKRDISKLSVISFALIASVFMLAFHEVRRPVLAMLTLMVAVMVTTGITAGFPGHLTLLSSFFASILFGLGIEFGVHIVGRVEELITAGVDEAEAIPVAVSSVARGLLTGGLATALAFYAMTFSGFRGFAELGIIAGNGVLACLLAMVTFFPALLALWHRMTPRIGLPKPFTDRVGSTLVALQRKRVAIGLLILVIVGFFVGKPTFDADYLNLEPRNSEAVRLEREMVKRSNLSPQFAVFVTDTREKARRLADSLLGDPTVGDVRSIADIDMLTDMGVDPASIPAGYRNAFQSENDRFAVYAYPQGDVWSPEGQTEFIHHMQAIDAGVTGMPMLGQFMVEQSKRGMFITAGLGLLIVTVCVGLDFRNFRHTFFAILPTLLSIASLQGLMKLFGLAFNSINVMAIPLIIGSAVDSGVHILHRFKEEQGDTAKMLKGTGRSIILTAATNVASFGTLMFTEHRGLASFAALMTIGILSVVILSTLVLPTLLAWVRPWLLPEPAEEKPF